MLNGSLAERQVKMAQAAPRLHLKAEKYVDEQASFTARTASMAKICSTHEYCLRNRWQLLAPLHGHAAIANG
jgi:hypothetical protein